MSLTFPTTTQKKPSGLTALPNQMKRPAFGTLHGFDAQGGASGGDSFSNDYSLQFDGTDMHLEVSSGSDLDDAGDVSISCWIKWDSSNTTFKFFWGKATGTTSSYRQYMMAVRSGSSPAPISFYSQGTGGGYFTSASTVSADAWHHIVVTVDSGATNGAKIYIDGAHDKTDTVTIPSSTSSFFIGKRNDGLLPFAGLIDEVAVWRSVLSAAQVSNIYKGETDGGSGGTNGTPGELASFSPYSWWRMGDGQSPTVDGSTPDTVNDQRAADNDAELKNEPLYKEDVPST